MATVVILEDNPEIASLYVQIFDQHRTLIMSDVPEAIGYLKKERPDLVIMDFHLPSGSGVDVLTYMRSKSQLKDVPVLGVSVDDLMKDEAVQHGMDAFLTKPIELTELINTAQRLMSTHTKPMVPSAELRAILNEYGLAYKAVYNKMPKGVWTGTQALIDGQPCDERWLRSETNRLRSLLVGGTSPRNYLMRLLDKVRRM